MLEDSIKKIKQEEMDDILKTSKHLENLLDEKASINLHQFEEYLLPFIIGNCERDEVGVTIFNMNYLDLAKSPRIGINVINNNDEIIYSLPPLLSTTPDLNTGINFNTIINIFNNGDLISKRSSIVMLSKASNVIENKLNEDSSTEETIIEVLTKIFHDYKDMVKDKKLVTEDVEAKQETVENGFIEY